MENVCGELKLTAPGNYEWKIGNKNSAGRWLSKFFSVPEYLKHTHRHCCLVIQPYNTGNGLGTLYLREFYDAPKKYDLRITLDYISRSKVISGEYEKIIKPSSKGKIPNKDCLFYVLETIETDGLWRVTIEFLKKRAANEQIQEIDKGISKSSTSPDIDPSSSSLAAKQKPLKKYRHPPNAYFLFSSEKRSSLHNSTTKDSKCYDSSTLGSMWRDLPNSEKAKYFSEAQRLKNLQKKSKTNKNSTVDNKESPTKRKLEDESLKEEQNKRFKRTALDALSGNLKEAFLSEEDTDVVIKVGDQEYKAHKVILRNRSPVFHSMLKNMTEQNQGVISIPDCDQSNFRDFLLYLYTGKLDNMSKVNVVDLYYMSDKYGIEELKQHCVAFILDNLHIDVICDAITLATRHVDPDVLKHVTQFFVDNAKNIVSTVNWKKFVKQYPIQANELMIKAMMIKKNVA